LIALFEKNSATFTVYFSLLKTSAKKITGIFYLLLGVTPLLSTLFISIQKEAIYQKMKQQLEYCQLKTIALPETAVIWVDNHEISINGQMFDIESKKLENGIYTFTGLYDDDETELIKEQQGTTEKDKQQNKLLAQFFKNLPVFFNQYNEFYKPSLKSYCYMVSGSQYKIEPFQKIPTPPPQVIASI
jgi:hypothetical protein